MRDSFPVRLFQALRAKVIAVALGGIVFLEQLDRLGGAAGRFVTTGQIVRGGAVPRTLERPAKIVGGRVVLLFVEADQAEPKRGVALSLSNCQSIARDDLRRGCDVIFLKIAAGEFLEHVLHFIVAGPGLHVKMLGA